MNILVLPRLNTRSAKELIATRWQLEVAAARGVAASSHPRQTFASNGPRISPEMLASFAEELRESASVFGYPLREMSDSEAKTWDARATEITWKYLNSLVVAEAGRADVWAFLTVVVCPDLVLWRFPAATKVALPPGLEARFLGGRRNLIRRFWLRARALASVGADWSVLQQVREDDLVQVFERPSLSAVPSLAGMLITQIAALPETVSSRDILKRLNRELAVTAMYCLEREELGGVLVESTKASIEAIRLSEKKTR